MNSLKALVVTFILSGCLAGIVSIFWYHEIKYSLPTPIPKNFKSVSLNSKIDLKTEKLKGPIFLHFYNPDCPCSRFNASHVQALIREHGATIRFLILVPSEGDVARAKTEFGSQLSYVVDKDQQIAAACGVYSTPQAVILNKDNVLYFRGNYNKSRYCTNKTSNFAELALLSFINKQPAPVLDLSSSLAYGCELKDQANSLSEIF